MIENVEAVAAALAAGENVVDAIRAATGYTIEQIAILSGLSEADLVDLESPNLERLLSALGVSITS